MRFLTIAVTTTTTTTTTTYLCVSSHRVAEALAVATLVTAARVVQAVLVVAARFYFLVTRLEHVANDDGATLVRPVLSLRMLVAGVRRRFAVGARVGGLFGVEQG